MACCVPLAGILRNCDASMGGIKRAWIACYNDVQPPTVTADKITKLNFTAGSFYEYEFKKETGSFTTTINPNDATGAVYYSTDIILQFAKQETAKRKEIAALAVGDLIVIIEDSNGLFWYFGYSYPVTMSAGTGETGTAFADFNGYNITLSDQSIVYPYEIDAAAMSGILGEDA